MHARSSQTTNSHAFLYSTKMRAHYRICRIPVWGPIVYKVSVDRNPDDSFLQVKHVLSTLSANRLGIKEFNRAVSQAIQSDLEVYGVFGEGKLYVFYYTKQT